jgi:rhamnosyltransferase
MIAAIIVLYKPDRAAFHRLVLSLDGQVDHVIVVDNTPQSEVTPLGQLLPADWTASHHYTSLGKNIGIASAQNIGIRKALDAGASHIILFDQDSVPGPKMVQALLSAESELVAQGLRVAAVGPVFVDMKTGALSPVVRYSFLGLRTIVPDRLEPIEAHFLIASGCLIRVSVLASVGLMREDLFIDWVDNEWGLRARAAGMLCFVVPQARMEHSVGDGTVRILGKQIHLHTEARNYYLIRNAIFLMRSRTMGLRWKVSFLPRIPVYLFLYPLLAENKLSNFGTLFRALRDGLFGRLGNMEHT